MKPTLSMSVLVLAGGCVPVSTTPSNLVPVKPAEVQLAVPPDAAYDRTVAAFLAQGYKIDVASKESGVIKSVGVLGDLVTDAGLFGMGTVNVTQQEMFFRANIVRSGAGSTVFLSSSGRTRDQNGRIGPESEMYECPEKSPMPGMGGALQKCRASMDRWKAKVDSIAARIRDAR